MAKPAGPIPSPPFWKHKLLLSLRGGEGIKFPSSDPGPQRVGGRAPWARMPRYAADGIRKSLPFYSNTHTAASRAAFPALAGPAFPFLLAVKRRSCRGQQYVIRAHTARSSPFCLCTPREGATRRRVQNFSSAARGKSIWGAICF